MLDRTNNHNLPHTHSTSPLPTTMSQDDAGPLRRLQVAIDILGEQDSVQEGVYLNACEALKEIHSLGKLYKVSYYEFTARRGPADESQPFLDYASCTSIMTRDGADGTWTHSPSWNQAFTQARLPHDLSKMVMNRPYPMTDDKTCIVVTEIVPYLKRSREDEQQ
jgi:hypothetical protein